MCLRHFQQPGSLGADAGTPPPRNRQQAVRPIAAVAHISCGWALLGRDGLVVRTVTGINRSSSSSSSRGTIPPLCLASAQCGDLLLQSGMSAGAGTMNEKESTIRRSNQADGFPIG